jgi:tRNA-modifying protein YgfZ
MAFYTQISSGAIQVTGTDRLDFVQGQVAQNIKTLAIPGGARSMILNVKGQIEFDVRIYRRKDDIYLQTAPDLSDAVMARLQKYIVFDDVKLENLTDQIRVYHVSGEGTEQFMTDQGFKLEAGNVQLLETTSGLLLVSKLDRGNGIGFDLHVLNANTITFEYNFAGNQMTELSSVELEKLRVVSGLANAHTDGFVGMLPQECGLLGGVSFKKGCYVGQEIMARLEARGHSNKTLVRIKLEQKLETGTPVTLEGREVGQLGHVVPFENGFTALAVMRIDALEKPNLEAGGLKLEVQSFEERISSF